MQSKANHSPQFIEQQPAVIPVFFATEMWERFGFYMIQGLLVLYMTSHVFGFSDSKSYAILSAFTAISYMTPILGGYIASRILDFEHAITLGGFLLAIGYAILSLPHQSFFYVALAVISIGNGFFKPNISSYLGDFYHPEDPCREKGYTIFYVGINVGVLLSTASSGYLVRYFGWHVPFLIASIGLLIGTVTFVFGIYYLKNTKNFHRVKPSIAHKHPTAVALVYFGIILLFIAAYEVISHRAVANQLMLWGGCGVLLGLIFYAIRYCKAAARNKMLACIFLMLISVVFWAIFFQMFFSMNLFIDRAVNRQFFQWTLPTPLFIALESIFIVVLGPYFAFLWQRLARKKRNPGIPLKFTLAMFAIAIAFVIAYLGTQHLDSTSMCSKYFIVFAYFFITVGELLLSPIGLMMITVLAPQQLIGLMMGVWFVSLGLGVKLAGVIADYAAIPKNIHSIIAMDTIYGNAFLHYAILSMICCVIALMMVPF
ncbi:MAG: peptide MFS transporter, partial [Gammaproteobacteria bacterium]|nr:peptide MFS transporter [Gammaproteobacteria bacterium]